MPKCYGYNFSKAQTWIRTCSRILVTYLVLFIFQLGTRNHDEIYHYPRRMRMRNNQCQLSAEFQFSIVSATEFPAATDSHDAITATATTKTSTIPISLESLRVHELKLFRVHESRSVPGKQLDASYVGMVQGRIRWCHGPFKFSLEKITMVSQPVTFVASKVSKLLTTVGVHCYLSLTSTVGEDCHYLKKKEKKREFLAFWDLFLNATFSFIWNTTRELFCLIHTPYAFDYFFYNFYMNMFFFLFFSNLFKTNHIHSIHHNCRLPVTDIIVMRQCVAWLFLNPYAYMYSVLISFDIL